MHFVYPLPWWLAILLATGVALLAFLEYRRPLAPLPGRQRGVLIVLRWLTLVALVAFLFRPLVSLPPSGAREAIVPVLVDVSRSMRLNDADGQPRIARARALLKTKLLPALSPHFVVEILGVGEGIAPAKPGSPGRSGHAESPGNVDAFSADASRSNLSAALNAVRERYRGQPVAGIVLLSDGGDTEAADARPAPAGGPPVFTVGIGSPERPRDREIVGVTAGDQRIDRASVDLDVTALSSGFGRAPFQLRLLANGNLIDTRRVVPPADGSPVHEVFTVSPDPFAPTVYTAEIPREEAEIVAENNLRRVLVSPAGRKRRVLVIEGAPGFEHSFMKRAWAKDPALEVDSVVRKGKNGEGEDTFFVQAGAGRAAALTSGFPARREDLFGYDALVIANVEGDFFTRPQLAMAADFVSERGGGLLVLGGRSFVERGLAGTALEPVLPVELNDRRGVLRASLDRGQATHNKILITPEGEAHPVMRIGASPADTRRLWSALPPLAASAPLGGPRPGATLLAVTEAAGGDYPVIAAQRYGRGRSLIFAGEASWRWKMMLAASDRSYEFFWRQSARWLASPAPDPVGLSLAEAAQPGDAVSVEVEARDGAFAPVAGATVRATVTAPDGDARPLNLGRVDVARGKFATLIRPEQAGLYRVHVEARRGSTSLGAAEGWLYVGGVDREFADPRLNEGFLGRVARGSGGRYVRAADVSHVVSGLQSSAPQKAIPEQRDLWHEPWAFATIVALLAGEWTLRRRWGLR